MSTPTTSLEIVSEFNKRLDGDKNYGGAASLLHDDKFKFKSIKAKLVKEDEEDEEEEEEDVDVDVDVDTTAPFLPESSFTFNTESSPFISPLFPLFKLFKVFKFDTGTLSFAPGCLPLSSIARLHFTFCFWFCNFCAKQKNKTKKKTKTKYKNKKQSI